MQGGKGMDREELYRFILSQGYRTHEEVVTQFSSQNSEIVEMNLTALAERRRLRKAPYRAGEKNSVLYLIPPGD